MSDLQNPYRVFEGTREWMLIDRALQELSTNNELVETADHMRIVGYLCKALASSAEDIPSPERRREALKELQDMVRNSDLHGRDLVGELIAERRAEAEHG